MNNVNDIRDSFKFVALKEDYVYSLHEFSPADIHENQVISELDVVNAHYTLSDFFLEIGEEVRYGILNYNLLSSAVSRQYVGYGGDCKWNDDFHKMATLLYGLTMDHAFHDGNKRTALLSVLLYMNRCKRIPTVSASMFEELVVRIASNSLYLYKKDYKRYVNLDDPEVNFIADKIRSWTRQSNTRLYTITFAECNTKLRRFNVKLDNPSGNAINVYKLVRNKPLFGKETEKWKRVCQVGFPGWKKQVSESDMKAILSSAGLTMQQGVDSDVFFNDAAPTYELLDFYRKPLARLKDR